MQKVLRSFAPTFKLLWWVHLTHVIDVSISWDPTHSPSLQLCQSWPQQQAASEPLQHSTCGGTIFASGRSLKSAAVPSALIWDVAETWVPQSERSPLHGLISVSRRSGLIPKRGSCMLKLPSSSKQKYGIRAADDFTVGAKVSLTCSGQRSGRKTNCRQAEKRPRVSVCTIDPCGNTHCTT